MTFALLLVVWMASLLAIATSFVPDGYFYSYFSVDYSRGFVRRGLAGEIVNLFPRDDYFGALRVLRWSLTGAYSLGLAGLMWSVLGRGRRSRRKWLLALLIPVLPFGFAFGLFSARTDLFGAAALAAFAVSLTTVTSRRGIVVLSAAFGTVLAVLTLMHEATPFLFGLGALAALTVLAPGLTGSVFRSCSVLAVGPGLATALAVTVFGQQGIAQALCQSVPHGPVNHPMAGKLTASQILHGVRYDIDYHDWMCRAILPLFDQSFGDAMQFVRGIGVLALAGSTLFGIGVLAASTYLIAQASGVPVRRFRDVLLTRKVAVALGLVLFLPVFLTGVDWIRWWTTIAYDLGIVFVLYATRQPEIGEPPTRRSTTVVAVAGIVLALLPVGVIPVFGAPTPM
ncbi:membrane protein [Mycolicibacterium hodleri]